MKNTSMLVIFNNDPHVSPKVKMNGWKLYEILTMVCILKLMLLEVVELWIYFTGFNQKKKKVVFAIFTMASKKSYPLTDWYTFERYSKFTDSIYHECTIARYWQKPQISLTIC